MIDLAASDRIAFIDRPLDSRDTTMPRQQRGMIADAAKARCGERAFRHLRMAERGDDEIGARRNLRSLDHLRMCLHVHMETRGTACGGETVLALGDDHTSAHHSMGEQHLKRLHSEMARACKRNPQDLCPQAEKASLKARSPGGPFSIDRMARLPLP